MYGNYQQMFYNVFIKDIFIMSKKAVASIQVMLDHSITNIHTKYIVLQGLLVVTSIQVMLKCSTTNICAITLHNIMKIACI